MMTALATTVHDPANLLYAQMSREWPKIRAIFTTIAVNASPTTSTQLLGFLHQQGATIQLQPESDEEGVLRLGEARRDVVIESLKAGDTHTLHCDFDRVLHWAETYPDELVQVVAKLPSHDFTVLGRTPRAFDSHPLIQRDTERIINHVYALASRNEWDITAAARGISQRAAAAIEQGCPERNIGVDAAWTLFVQQQSELTMAYVETEGLEFETVDRYMDEAEALGGVDAWIERLDSNPRHWAFRARLTWLEIEAMQEYLSPE